MAEDWLADVRKYAADADEAVVRAIVRYCGIALQKRDSSLVSFSDSKETDRVRNNFLKKKLGLTQEDSVLDAAIAAVGERMKADHTKNRVTVYYLLADYFDSLSVFGGASRGAAVAAAGAAGVAGLAALSPASAAPAEPSQSAPAAPAVPAEPVAPAQPQAAMAAAAPAAVAAPAYAASVTEPDRYTPGWDVVAWLIGGLLIAGFIAMTYMASRQPREPLPAPAAVPAATAPAATAPAAPAPEGAGVVAGERDARPMLTVYFDTAKAAVAPDFPAVAAAVKAYVDANPAATLAVSGFNDPTGNAAANAELSKNRAKNVKAALESMGIAADRVLLEKPAETTGTGANNAESRRVEVVIKG